MTDWKQTPTLDEFAAMYDEDEHLWWRIGCGHHQNLYEAAVERYERAEAAIARVRELIDSADNNGEWPWMLVRVSAVREILEGDKR